MSFPTPTSSGPAWPPYSRMAPALLPSAPEWPLCSSSPLSLPLVSFPSWDTPPQVPHQHLGRGVGLMMPSVPRGSGERFGGPRLGLGLGWMGDQPYADRRWTAGLAWPGWGTEAPGSGFCWVGVCGTWAGPSPTWAVHGAASWLPRGAFHGMGSGLGLPGDCWHFGGSRC